MLQVHVSSPCFKMINKDCSAETGESFLKLNFLCADVKFAGSSGSIVLCINSILQELQNKRKKIGKEKY